jgi:IS30 family transposase
VSHETIYWSLYIQARGALKKELLEHVRRSRNMRRSRHHTQKTDDQAGSVRRYRSASVLQVLTIVRFQDTGRVTCSLVATAARLPLWSSVRRATSCS